MPIMSQSNFFSPKELSTERSFHQLWEEGFHGHISLGSAVYYIGFLEMYAM